MKPSLVSVRQLSVWVRPKPINQLFYNCFQERGMQNSRPDRKARVAPQGEYLHIPYDWRRPTLARIKNRIWNPDDPRVLVPKAFGWGWTVNFNALLRKMRLVR